MYPLVRLSPIDAKTRCVLVPAHRIEHVHAICEEDDKGAMAVAEKGPCSVKVAGVREELTVSETAYQISDAINRAIAFVATRELEAGIAFQQQQAAGESSLVVPTGVRVPKG